MVAVDRAAEVQIKMVKMIDQDRSQDRDHMSVLHTIVVNQSRQPKERYGVVFNLELFFFFKHKN